VVKEDFIKYEATVRDVMPNAMYRVELDNGHIVLAYIAGRARSKIVRLYPGDRVVIEMSPYDLTRGRIVYHKR
jgi:translation initiation factor IF-1